MIESFLHSFFKEGALIVRLPSGNFLSINGATEADAAVIVHLTTWRAARRIATDPEMALGESFMDGGLVLERGSIYDLLELIALNYKYHRQGRMEVMLRAALAFLRTQNDRLAARRNVAHHYDLSVDLYRTFLDADLQYSCAYFPEEGMNIEDAQIAKKRHIADKLLLEPGQSVLDIGCGWGGMGLTLAGEFGANVTGITLSVEQLNLARERAEAAGLTDRAHFLLQDYRDVKGPFDRIVSVGMLEHVGRRNFQSYFDVVARQLSDDGVALIHTIGRPYGPQAIAPWFRKYIFPGSYTPALSELLPAIERARLVVTDIEILRLHYASTLRAWRERFNRQPAQLGERFHRMWEYYLAASEIGFRDGGFQVYQLQLAKKQDAVPITRDYLHANAVTAPGLRMAG